MTDSITWYDGFDNFKKHTITKKSSFKKQTYNLEIIDQEVDDQKNIKDIFFDHVKNRQTPKVEMLYSGGVDSEFVLHCLIALKIPTDVITMRLLFKDCPLNTHDLYYSEKYCRENNLNQKFIDIDIQKFYENEYLDYLRPYNITFFHIATHFYLLSKCDYFPIIGGGHTWPWNENKNVISPVRYENNMHDRYMKDNSITGIGNMMLHSYQSNYKILKEHVQMCQTTDKHYGGDSVRIIDTKKDLYERLCPDLKLTPRIQTYGWENILPIHFDKSKRNLILLSQFGHTDSTITWGEKIAGVLGGYPGTNDKYG